MTGGSTAAVAARAGAGHLTYDQFVQGLGRFSSWWQQQCPSQPLWVLASVALPVTGQVVQYAVMDRLLLTAPAGSEENTPPQQQQHQQLAADASSCTPRQQQHQPPPGSAGSPAHAAASAQSLTRKTHAAAGYDTAAGGTAAANDDDDDDDAVADPVMVPAGTGRQAAAVLHQYSIVFHDTYRVPVLYLRAMWPDGQLLSLGELMQHTPQLQAYQEPDQAAWTFVTALEHPLLRTQCVMLHPCQTAERLALMLADGAEGDGGSSSIAVQVEAARGGMAGEASQPAAGATPPAATSDVRQSQHQLLRYMQAWFSMVVAAPFGLQMPPPEMMTAGGL